MNDYLCRRLTKDNVKPSGRQIGKLSHNNPGIIFDYVRSTNFIHYDTLWQEIFAMIKFLLSEKSAKIEFTKIKSS